MDQYDTKKSVFLDLDTPMTKLSWVKIAVMGITVIPRVILMVLVLSIMALLSSIATMGWDMNEPLPPGRRRIVKLSRFCPLLALKIANVSLTVKGWENYLKAEEEGVGVMTFNHVSYLDAFGLVGLCVPSGVSKASNQELPILGTCVKALQNISVPEKSRVVKMEGNKKPNQEASGPSITDLIVKHIADRRYPMLCMAPEGTCGNGKCLLKFKTGGFIAGKPVLPVCIKYRHKHLNPAWSIIHEPMHFLRLMCQFINYMEMSFLPIYTPSEEEQKNPVLFAENVRKLMGQYLNVPLVEEGINEFIGLKKAKVETSYDGSKIEAPKGVIDEHGIVDLTAYLKKTK